MGIKPDTSSCPPSAWGKANIYPAVLEFKKMAAELILKTNPKGHYWPIPPCCVYDTPPCGGGEPPYQYQVISDPCWSHNPHANCNFPDTKCIRKYKKCSFGIDTIFEQVGYETDGSCGACNNQCD